METLRMTRRTFLKATAVTGVAAALYSPDMFPLKGLAEAEESAVGAGEKVIRSYCYNCKAECQMLCHVRDGRLVKVVPDPEGFYNEGTACPKGLATIQTVYNPLRITYPMKRTRPKGDPDPGWVRISWDEAIDTVANNLLECREKYGPESLIFTSGTGRVSANEIVGLMAQFFGSPNQLSGGYICWVYPRVKVRWTIMGKTATMHPGVLFDQSKVVFSNSSLFYSNTSKSPRVATRAIFEKGIKIICPDPRYSCTASMAERWGGLWLPVRPGTDGAMLMSMLHVIFTENLYDKDFLVNWTNGPFLVVSEPRKPQRGGGEDPGSLLTEAALVEGGSPWRYIVWDEESNSPKYWDATIGVMEWEESGIKPALFGSYKVTLADGREVECKPVLQLLSERCAEYAPEKAEEITWVPREKIQKAARMYATEKPSGYWCQVAYDQHTNTTRTQTLNLGIMPAVLGNFDIEGGIYDTVGARVQAPSYRIPPEVEKRRLGWEEYPLLTRDFMGGAHPPTAWQAMVTGKPYQPRAMFTCAGNPCSNDTNTNEIFEAIKAMDFYVNVDLFMTPAAEAFADIILPGSWWVEREDFFVGVRKAAIKPVGGRTEYQIATALARRSDPEKWPWKTEAELLDWKVEPLGLTWEEFREIGWHEPKEKIYKKYEKGLLRKPGPPFPYWIDGEQFMGRFFDGKPGFATPTGKMEIYSTVLRGYGYDPLPYYAEPAESPYSDPEMAKEYPLIMTTGARHIAHLHSEGRQIPWLNELFPENWLEINPETALKLGIEDGDMAYVETPVGRICAKAIHFAGIHPSVVHTYNGWMFPSWQEAEVNVIISNKKCDPEGGVTPMRSFLCKVYKAEGVSNFASSVEEQKKLLPTSPPLPGKGVWEIIQSGS